MQLYKYFGEEVERFSVTDLANMAHHIDACIKAGNLPIDQYMRDLFVNEVSHLVDLAYVLELAYLNSPDN